MTMLEKLARAISLAYWTAAAERRHTTGGRDPDTTADEDWQDWLPEARAVLTALREPDEGMIRAAYVAAVEEFYALPDETTFDSVRRRLGVVSWKAQIDAILNEKAASL